MPSKAASNAVEAAAWVLDDPRALIPCCALQTGLYTHPSQAGRTSPMNPGVLNSCLPHPLAAVRFLVGVSLLVRRNGNLAAPQDAIGSIRTPVSPPCRLGRASASGAGPPGPASQEVAGARRGLLLL